MLLTTPNKLPVEFTQGDTPTLTLVATDDQGNPVDLTGASLSTQIQGANGAGVHVIPNAQHTLANQVTTPGQFAIALTAVDTNASGEGPNKEIITTATVGAVVTNYRGVALLTVYNAAPTQ